jgi:hypothetical protein
MSRFQVISDGTPEGDRAATLAQKILDAMPEPAYQRIMGEAGSQGDVARVEGLARQWLERHERLADGEKP